MSSNSSTSNSKPSAAAIELSTKADSAPVVLNALEQLPARKFPWAALVLLLAIIAIEAGLHVERIWFADRAAWQWEVKKQMLAEGKLKGDMAILGTSVLFHGLDPSRMNEVTNDHPHVVNLALNGMQINHIAQTFENELQKGNRYAHVLLELRDLDISRDNWIGGPYWRLWATWDDLAQSSIPIHETSQVIPFAANRVMTSFNYRKAIDNWVFASAKAHRPTNEYAVRNKEVGDFMIAHLGFSAGEFPHNVASSPAPPAKAHPWAPNAQGSYWFNHFLTTCEKYSVRVTLLVPPAPSYILRDRAMANYDAALEAYIAKARLRHPTLQLDTLRIDAQQYELADFADDHHMSPQGTKQLTDEVAKWAAGQSK